MDATEPARRVGPCITQASSSTTPSSFGQAAIADGIVIGIVFYFCHDSENRIECVAAGFQHVHSVIEVLQAIRGGNDQRTSALRRGGECEIRGLVQILRACAGSARAKKTLGARGDSSGQCGQEEFSARPFFHFRFSLQRQNDLVALQLEPADIYGLNPTLCHSSAQLYMVPLVITNFTVRML